MACAVTNGRSLPCKSGVGGIKFVFIAPYTTTTRDLVVDTDVSGYSVKNTEVFPHGTQYRAFVLLEYSDAEARKILTNRLRKEEQLFNRLKVTKAWKELDNAVEEEKNRDSARRKSELNALAR